MPILVSLLSGLHWIINDPKEVPMNDFLQSCKCFIVVMSLSFVTVTGVMAATVISTASGNWSATAWPNTTRTGTITTSTASATITGTGTAFLTEISVGNIIKTTGNVVIGTVLSITSNTSLTLAANAASTNAGISYNVQGIGAGDIAEISGGTTITVDVSTAVCASFQGTNTSPNSAATLLFNAGSHLTVSGTVTVGGDFAHPLNITMTSGGILTCAGFTIGNAGTWTPGTGTVELTATNTLPTTFFTSFNNLNITGGTTTNAVNLAINGTLNVSDGAAFSAGAFTLTVTGATTIGGGTSGTLTITSSTGAKTFTGLVTINAGGTWNNSGNSAVIFQGGITNSGTFTAGTGIQTFNTSAQALTGTFSIPSVTATGITVTNNNTLTVTTALAGTGTLAQAAGATLNLNFTGAPGITGLTATASGNTVNYGFAGTQTVFSTNYYHLTLSNTSAKTLQTGTTAISGNLTLSGTASATAVTGLTIGGNVTIGTGTTFNAASFTHPVAGNWSRSGTFTAGTSTIAFNGSSLQTITATGGESFYGLTVNNSAAGIQLENAAVATNTLTMTQGNIDLNGNNLTLGTSAANVGTLSRTTGTMLNTGSFIRWFNTSTIADGAVTGLFPVGTATNYRPFFVSAPVTAPTTGGTITLTYTDASGTTTVSFADGAATVMVRTNLNWTLSTGNGLAGGTYDLLAEGTGFGTIGNVSDLRLTLANSVVGTAGTNAGTTTNPQINRTGLTLANLSNTFYVGSVNSVTSPLPITLISFTASVVGGSVKLDWSTAAEINNDYFTVQRSKDGATWDSLQRVAGSGNSSGTSVYSAYDRTPYTGISYYRLVQTDFDGKQSYSPILSVSIQQASSSIFIFPNPAADNVLITFSTAGKYEISLFSSAGQRMSNPVLLTGDRLQLDISALKAGVYFIHIATENSTETRKIVIMK